MLCGRERIRRSVLNPISRPSALIRARDGFSNRCLLHQSSPRLPPIGPASRVRAAACSLQDQAGLQPVPCRARQDCSLFTVEPDVSHQGARGSALGVSSACLEQSPLVCVCACVCVCTCVHSPVLFTPRLVCTLKRSFCRQSSAACVVRV